MQVLKERLRDLEIVIRSTSDYRRNKLRSIAGSVDVWDSHVQREKAVFHTLNLFNYDVTNKCLIAEGWCPTSMLPEVLTHFLALFPLCKTHAHTSARAYAHTHPTHTHTHTGS